MHTAAHRELDRPIDSRLHIRFLGPSTGDADMEAERHLELFAGRQEPGPLWLGQGGEAVYLRCTEHARAGHEVQLGPRAPDLLLCLLNIPPRDLRQRKEPTTALLLQRGRGV